MRTDERGVRCCGHADFFVCFYRNLFWNCPGVEPMFAQFQLREREPMSVEVRTRAMFLSEVENHVPQGAYATSIRHLRDARQPVPQIMHLFAYKPDRTTYLSKFTQGVMRGPSPLSPGFRELIAAFTSKRNECPF